MLKTVPTDTTKVMQQNISYYDEIAAQYNHILDEDDKNRRLRQQVAAHFTDSVIPGYVLDFGTGTGKDLSWLTGNGYRVICCEPSDKMREQAIQFSKAVLPGHPITFLDPKNTDFRIWQRRLPFPQQVKGILANFAVLNCIPDLSSLFKSWAMVTNDHAHCWGLVLDSRFANRWKANRRATVQSLITGKQVTMQVRFNEHRQTVYLHTMAAIKKASAPWFEFTGLHPFQSSGFNLFHLQRK
jgi:SAM-dependent methyltransferase